MRLVSGNVLTVERGLNGTTAVTHADGSDLMVMGYPAAVSEATLLIAGRLFSRKDPNTFIWKIRCFRPQ